MEFPEKDEDYPFVHNTDEDLERAAELARTILGEMITWREVSEQDISAVADLRQFLLAKPPARWIFQDKAVTRLLSHYIKRGEHDEADRILDRILKHSGETVASASELIQERIEWREVSRGDLCQVYMQMGRTKIDRQHDRDSENRCGMPAEDFVDLAMRALFNHAYKEKDRDEFSHLKELILEQMQRDPVAEIQLSDCFRKILIFLIRINELEEARTLAEDHLLSIGSLRRTGGEVAVNSWLEFPVEGWDADVMDQYVQILNRCGETDLGVTILKNLLVCEGLDGAERASFETLLERYERRPYLPVYPIETVDRGSCSGGSSDEEPVEETALRYLKGKHDKEGIVAHISVWQLLSEYFRGELRWAHFARWYGEEGPEPLPDSFRDFVQANEDTLRLFVDAPNSTYSLAGLPDLILYGKDSPEDFVLIEVKSEHDRLSPDQIARIRFFQEHEIPFRLLQFE